jgi:cytochrome c553
LFFRVCRSCHGETGRGSNKIARLAGQKSEYLVKSLKRYRGGGGERMDPLMAASTKNLADAEINALAAFISTMK